MKKIRNITLLLFLFPLLIGIIGCRKKVVEPEFYAINYNVDGGILNTNFDDFCEEDNFELPIPTKKGYEFIGWYLSSDFSGKVQTHIDGSIKKDIDLYAKWELIEPTFYTVTYDTDGGTKINSVTVESGTYIYKPVAPTKEGYDFVGWYLDEKEFDFDEVIESDITLVAKWANKKYTISFNSNGGNAVDNLVSEAGQYINAPEIPIREGYKFLGWYLNGIEYEFNLMPNQNIVLNAKWIKSYKISFVNAEIEQLIYTKEDEIELPIPEKEGYLFCGWYTTYAYQGDPITKIELGTTGNLSYIAKWEKCFKIEYNPNEGVMPEEYNEYYILESEYVLPVPTRLGYKFVGWTEDVESANIEVMHSVPVSYEEDIYITAVWDKQLYSVTYKLGDNLFVNHKQLYRAFFTDFYYYIKDYKGADYQLERTGAYSVEDFLNICCDYTGGAAGMSQVGNYYSQYYLRLDTGGNIENQTEKDGFIGYCLANNMYVEFVYFLQDFFYYWRLDEGYTYGPSDPYGTGSDFLASPWASLVDTAKFFYYTKETLPNYFTGKTVPTFYDKIPYIVNTNGSNFIYTYDWEKGLTLPNNLSIEGYTFLGWYDNPEFNGDVITKIEAGIFNDITVYAKIVKNEKE